jgi:hypothetical protein
MIRGVLGGRGLLETCGFMPQVSKVPYRNERSRTFRKSLPTNGLTFVKPTFPTTA